MRLSDVLSKDISAEFLPVDNFFGYRKSTMGKSKKIDIGTVALKFFCEKCKEYKTFYSKHKADCIYMDEKITNINCMLFDNCNTFVVVSFFIEIENSIINNLPKVRILKKNINTFNNVKLIDNIYGEYTDKLERANIAFNANLGAGSIIYLRKVFELITGEMAHKAGIDFYFIDKKGKKQKKTFRNLLEEVDKKCNIIPIEFSKDGYNLFCKLSDIIHGEYNENTAIEKFDAFYRLITGILDNIKNREELIEAAKKVGLKKDE
ncbi:hypothetical protein [Brachyspira hyodysenteriae]|uniref:hypothetical protein n=1 Tax=Brachyspira hyodysenteriae TaxID=159 RepID=UPI00118414B8|nr:hypothetical protein [Brachyspira hyodysenteriae]TVL60682.1 hypothetical protein A9X83_03220 [Brachyspira hyodysenteriae]TVL79833.1 hypothetical protein A9X82_04980 [Brachyspira hyodysenteriae]